jgi:hypothetical protein
MSPVHLCGHFMARGTDIFSPRFSYPGGSINVEISMKKFLLASVAAIALIATPAFAQISQSPETDDDAVIGGTAGAATGGALGFLVGGPIGAIIGGFTGAVLGAEASVPDETIVYAGNHPVAPVVIDSGLSVGSTVPESVTIYPVEPTPEYGYLYANNRVYIVENTNRQIVYSPGFVVPEGAVAFVESNPMPSVQISGAVEAGATLDGTIEVAAIPDYPAYGYIYVNDRPALVDMGSHTVIWVK